MKTSYFLFTAIMLSSSSRTNLKSIVDLNTVSLTTLIKMALNQEKYWAQRKLGLLLMESAMQQSGN